MCGICCRLRRVQQSSEPLSIQIDDLTRELLNNRGPNAHSELNIETEQFTILLCGFVLWQQGANICKQPYSYKHHVLLINGDIFSKRSNRSVSDTEWLTQEIDNCNDEAQLLELFRSLTGPYSIFYLNRETNQLYFLRDIFGRQSLLIARSPEGDSILSSVLAASKQHYTKCLELPPLGVFCLNLNTNEIQMYPWQLLNDTHLEQLKEVEHIFDNTIEIKSIIASPWLIKNSFEDCTNSYNFESILKDHINQGPNEIFEYLSENGCVMSVCDELIMRLEHSISDRILATPPQCRECMKLKCNKCDHARIGILFSGGIDCSILAVLTDKLLDPTQPIDLINVSFEKINRSTFKAPIDYNTPDRISARDSLQELKTISPKRHWNLVEINVTRMEMNEALKTRISHLVYPLNSVLDESIGLVLWFGGRGCGSVNGNNYSTNCRVLLIGSGADELFGGYTRHRNAFLRSYVGVNTSPFERLENELEFDFHRLPSRNLARDDRVIGDHGVTARSPYLEEEFVSYVRKLNPYQKCYHSLEQGVGDKLLLRLCGFYLGLQNASYLKKRAMQFGSRVADRKQNAKDVSKTLIRNNE